MTPEKHKGKTMSDHTLEDTYTVSLESEECGSEDFTYDTNVEALAAAARLYKSAQKHFIEDGIERRVVLHIR